MSSNLLRLITLDSGFWLDKQFLSGIKFPKNLQEKMVFDKLGRVIFEYNIVQDWLKENITRIPTAIRRAEIWRIITVNGVKTLVNNGSGISISMLRSDNHDKGKKHAIKHTTKIVKPKDDMFGFSIDNIAENAAESRLKSIDNTFDNTDDVDNEREIVREIDENFKQQVKLEHRNRINKMNEQLKRPKAKYNWPKDKPKGSRKLKSVVQQHTKTNSLKDRKLSTEVIAKIQETHLNKRIEKLDLAIEEYFAKKNSSKPLS